MSLDAVLGDPVCLFWPCYSSIHNQYRLRDGKSVVCAVEGCQKTCRGSGDLSPPRAGERNRGNPATGWVFSTQTFLLSHISNSTTPRLVTVRNLFDTSEKERISRAQFTLYALEKHTGLVVNCLL